jgi:hypothetical protein
MIIFLTQGTVLFESKKTLDTLCLLEKKGSSAFQKPLEVFSGRIFTTLMGSSGLFQYSIVKFQ